MAESPTFTENDFRKASASQPDRECVRVARRDGWVELRDDKTTFGTPEDTRLVLTAAQFDDFLQRVRAGETTGLPIEMEPRDDGTFVFRNAAAQRPAAPARLEFSASEVEAFLDGIRRGEFDREAFAA